LKGTDTTGEQLNNETALAAASVTQTWCTIFNVPNPNVPGPGGYSKQHFARMWYDLLIGSPVFLDVVEGQDDPYSWTTGQGCGYTLGGERFSYTGQSESDILGNASREVYYIDEGAAIGPVFRNSMIGGATPVIEEINFANPFKEVKVIQTLYASLDPEDIVTRVQNCNHPDGPVDITLEDAKNILEIWKVVMEDAWSKGWDDENDGEVQFFSFYEGGNGVDGTLERILDEATLDSSKLTAIAILSIVIFSAMFLFSLDMVESRVGITLVGVGLVVMSFYAALGFGLLVGTKVRKYLDNRSNFILKKNADLALFDLLARLCRSIWYVLYSVNLTASSGRSESTSNGNQLHSSTEHCVDPTISYHWTGSR
jgi:hypothetical protein